MKSVSAWLVMIFGVLVLVFAVVGLFNSSLDTREMLLVAMLGAAISFIAVAAKYLSKRHSNSQLA